MFKRSDVKDVYSLSPLQQGMLFHYIKEGESESTVYFEQTLFSVNGDIDVELFEKSFNRVVEKYDVLRTVFIYKKIDIPRQAVLKEREAKVRFIDISTMGEEDRARYIEDFKQEDIRWGFDLKKDIPMRISVLKSDRGKYKIIWSYHHIIMDGWCLWIVMKDLLEVYRALKEGGPLEQEPAPAPPYSVYIKWLQKKDKKEGLEYWADYLRDYRRKAGLPTRNDVPGQGEDREGTHRLLIDKVVSRGLETLAKTNRVTVNSLFQTMWGILLQRYNNTGDVVFGAVVSGRPYEIEGIEKMVGLFINTIPVRITAGADETRFSTLVKAVQDREARSKAYEYLQLAEIQSNTPLKGDLLDHIMAFENFPVQEEVNDLNNRQTLGFTIESEGNVQQTNHDFLIVVIPGDSIHVDFKYNPRVYADDFIKRVAGHLNRVIAQVTENPHIDVNTLDIATEEEKYLLLNGLNDTGTEYPRDKTVHELFEEQAARTPDRVALIGPIKNGALSYRELNNRADRQAFLLKEKGVGTGNIVGLKMGRSVDMIVAVLAILKAGAGYLPIDPDYPEDRINYMLADSNAGVLLSELSESSEMRIANIPTQPLIHSSTQLCYIMYTSGSTGRPRGVVVEHRGVVRLVKNTNYLDFREDDRVLQIGASGFDASVYEIWGALLNGLQLHIAAAEAILSADRLKTVMRENKITTMLMTVSLFNRMLSADVQIFAGLRTLLIGGDVLSVPHVNKLRREFPGLNIINAYGPTENATISTAFRIEKEYTRSIPIGGPISNSTVVIIDSRFQLAPVGVCGEILVGGDGVARGYLNNPELTNRKFFGGSRGAVFQKSPPGRRRLYKTGDLGRWLPNGPAARGAYNIEFLGRVDNQVKIRGFRIEPGEIEAQLLALDGIEEAVVTAGEDQTGDKYLCAYFVPHRDRTMEPSELRQKMAARLPGNMVPGYFIPMDSLPLTPNGKVDRKALPLPEIKPGPGHTPPRGRVQEALAGIWSDVLGIEKEKIGIHDNFFQLGGHSLKATLLLSRVHRMLDTRVTLPDLFEHPTIKGLSERIEETGTEPFIPMEPVEEKEFYDLSYNQKRIWFLQQVDPRSPAYHMPGVIPMGSEVNVENVENTLRKMIERHESLRTGFKVVHDEPVQFVQKAVPLPFRFIDLSAAGEGEKETAARELVETPFDLETPPLFRTALLKTGERDWLLVYSIHHIVSDGWSMEIIKNEFSRFYEGYAAGSPYEPEPLTLRYRDFAHRHNTQIADGERKERSHRYWKEKVERGIPVLDLPYEPGKKDGGRKGTVYRGMLDKDTASALNKLAVQNNTTLFVVLFSIYILLLYRFSNREDIACGIVSAGRDHDSLRHIVGFFVNVILFTLGVDEDEPFHRFLKRVNAGVLELFQHQAYPAELVFEELNMRHPDIPVSFNMVNMGQVREMDEMEGADRFSTGHIPVEQDTKFELETYVTEYRDGIRIDWAYAKERFAPDTIEYMASEYAKLIDFFKENASKSYGDFGDLDSDHTFARD